MQVSGASGNTAYQFPVSSAAFSNVIPAPGAPGTYAVTTAYAPAPGNSLSPGSSAPTPITVTGSVIKRIISCIINRSALFS